MKRKFNATIGWAGFSLVELMVSIAVFSILISIGLPSYSYMVQDRYADNAAHTMHGLLSYTRQQAVALKKQVVLCGLSADQSGCVAYKWSGQSDWSDGAMIFVDQNENERYEPAIDVLVKLYSFSGQPLQIMSSTGSFIAYKRTGQVQGFSNGTLTFSSGDYSKQLKVTNLGRVRYLSEPE